MKIITQSIALALSLACLTGTAAGEVIFSDDFSDESRDRWFLVGNGEANDLSISDGVLMLSSFDMDRENNFSAVAAFPVADLNVPGAVITLELDFQNLKDHAFQRGIAIGLYDSRGTAIASDSEEVGTGDDDWGHFMYTRRFPFLHRLYENNGKGILDSTESAIRATDEENVALHVNRSNGVENVFGIADGEWHSFKLEIEAVTGRGGRVEHVITLTVDEGQATESVLTYRDVGVLVEKVDQIGIMSMRGNHFVVDNVKVTYSLP